MHTMIQRIWMTIQRRTSSNTATNPPRRRRRLGAELLEDRSLLTTLVVTSALDNVNPDDGVTTLREAINEANSSVGFDTIQFNIGGGGPASITLNSPLPGLHDDAITVDGRTQPGYSPLNGTPLIEINGQNLPVGQAGIWITGDQASVYGLAINRVNGVGVFFSAGANNATIASNHIGTDRTGTVDLGNAYQGIYSRSGGHLIVGNLISGNQFNGIWLDGPGAIGSQIVQNRIGVDVAGQNALGNGANGVVAFNGANSNQILNNIVGGNGGAGISLSRVNFNRIQGNTLGANINGDRAVPNATGLSISNGSSQNIVGTDGDGLNDTNEGNLISGNAGVGLGIYDAATGVNTIAGNSIGVDITGTVDLGNAFQGIFLQANSQRVENNLISGNDANGIWIHGSGGTTGQQNLIVGNRIGTNGEGTSALGNGIHGIVLSHRAASNHIGSDLNNNLPAASSERNLISGNVQIGVLIDQAGTNGNYVVNNAIGTDVSGTAAIPNSWGVIVGQGSGNRIGEINGLGNTISGNRQGGVAVIGGLAETNLIRNNYIGTDVTGLQDLGNAFSGVYLGDGGGFSIPFSTNPGAASRTIVWDNVISGNDLNGVQVVGGGHNIFHNNNVGLGSDGATAVGNARDGISLVDTANNDVGGAAALYGNVISSNGFSGIFVGGAGSTNNMFQGNSIGTDETGVLDRGNGDNGLLLSVGAANNLIGTDGDGTGDGQEGNLISGNAGAGIKVRGAMNNRIAGNQIGTDPSGAVAIANANGILVEQGAQRNLIGSNSDGVGDSEERNLISGNTFYGVYIRDANTSDNTFAGNYIGTSVGGSLAVPNGTGRHGGVLIQDSPDNQIGGVEPGAGNVVSGNNGAGIWMFGANATGNRLLGNVIGLNAAGAAALPNTAYGLGMFDAQDNIIGDVEAPNTISGNNSYGVWIDGPGATGNWLQGNRIGTNALGTHGIGNRSTGLRISGGANGNVIGANDDGVSDDREGNLISGNGSFGVEIVEAGSDNNIVAGNQIGTDATGTSAVGNRLDGIVIGFGAKSNRVGTDGDGISDAAERNVISGNHRNGVDIRNIGTNHNVLAGNYVGTDALGDSPLGNQLDGILIRANAKSNLIGTDADGVADDAEGNLISGNLRHGVFIAGSGASNITVAGNKIGVDSTGSVGLGNAGNGVRITNGASHNQIGGASAAERNIISGNMQSGVFIANAGSIENAVLGNFIGTDATGESPVGNAQYGVYLPLGSSDAWIRDNVVSGNALDGIFITDGQNHRIEGNFIGTNVAGDKAVPNLGAGLNIQGLSNGILVGTNGDSVADEAESNLISGNLGHGVFIGGAGVSNITVAGNKIGSDANGAIALGNAGDGVRITNGASQNRIGGTATAERNIISGNAQSGVFIANAGTTENIVLGNFIGTNANAEAPLGNSRHGVHLLLGSSDTTLSNNVVSGNALNGIAITDGRDHRIEGNFVGTNAGGDKGIANLGAGVSVQGLSSDILIGTNVDGVSDASEGNVISANGSFGVQLAGAGVSNITVAGNKIGTNAAGSNALGNFSDGVRLTNGVSHNRIGGTAAAARNIISGNMQAGVFLANIGTTDNWVLGNSIGTDATGAIALGNGGSGVMFALGAANNTIGVSDDSGLLGESNLIAHNAGSGVAVLSESTAGNSIRGNSIYSNVGLGIDLNGDGVTTNDPGDADTGPNQLQNYPELRAVRGGTETRIVGALDSTPTTTITLDFYANSAVNPLGFGEGQRYLGSFTLVTDANGRASFNVLLNAATGRGEFVTATATDDNGNSSEFSAATMVQGVRPKPDAAPGPPDFVTRGGSRNARVTLTAGSVIDTVNDVEPGSVQPEGRSLVFGLARDDALITDAEAGQSIQSFGGPGSVRLQGGSSPDELWSDGGDDILFGGPANDLLQGVLDEDVLNGEAGMDIMVTGPFPILRHGAQRKTGR